MSRSRRQRSRTRSTSVVLFVAALLAGCGDDDAVPGPADGAAADAGPPLVTPPAPPVAPAAPVRACASGWIPADPTATGDATCLPWPLDATCDGSAEALLPGEGCVHIGPDCPADPADFASNLPTDRPIVYVRRGAPAPGLGTRASPYPSIALGLAAAASTRAVVALSSGDFGEVATIPAGVTLWGACTGGSRTVEVVARTRDAAVRQLSLANTNNAVAVHPTGSLTVTDVVVERATGAAVVVLGPGALDGSGLVIRDVAQDATGHFGHGLEAVDGATVRLERVAIERAADFAVLAGEMGTTVELTNVSLRDVLRQRATARGGTGVQASNGASLVMRRFVVEHARWGGVESRALGTVVELDDGLVRGAGDGDGTNVVGVGIRSYLGASLSARQVEVVGTIGQGALADGAGSMLALEDSWVRGTRAATDGTAGGALVAQQGAMARAARCVFSGSERGGAIAISEGTTLEVEDLQVLGAPATALVNGLEASDLAGLSARRVLLQGAAQAGALVDSGASAIFEDVEVRDTGADALERGIGIAVQMGAQLSVSRVAVRDAAYVGVFSLGEGTTITGGDLLVDSVASAVEDGFFGHGLHAQEGGTIDLARVEVDGAHSLAVASIGAGSRIVLSQAAISRTQHAECETSTCPGNGAGTALFAIGDGNIQASDFVVSDAALCGVQLAGGTADLARGLVRRCRIGANVVTPGFDLNRILLDVHYVDNDRPLDTTMLPVPPTSAVLPP